MTVSQRLAPNPRSLTASRRRVGAFAAIAALVLASGCPADPRDANRELPVATIDGDVKIRPTTLLARLSRRGTPRIRGEAVRLVLARKALDGLIEEELLMRAATAANVTLEADAVDREVQRSAAGYPTGDFAAMLHAEQLTVAAYREALRRRLTIEAYLKGRVSAASAVTPAEIEAKYREELAKKPAQEEVLVRQVFVKTREEAAHILGEIKARRITLEEAARRYSTAPESEEGGALDWFARGEMPEVFDAAFALKVGTVSEVVASDYGFHLFELIAQRKPDAAVPLSSVRDRIAAELRRGKETKAINAIVKDLFAKANVVVDDAVLKATTAKLPPPPPEPDGGVPVNAPSGSDTAPVNPRPVDAGVAAPAPKPDVPVKTAPAPKPVVAPKPAPAPPKPAPKPVAAPKPAPKPVVAPQPAPKPVVAPKAVAKPAPKPAPSPTAVPAPKPTPKPAPAPKPAASAPEVKP